MVLDRGVVESLLLCALRPNLSSTLHGFSIVTSLSRRLFLMYDIVRPKPASLVKEEHCFSPTMITDWRQFCRETMLVYMEGCSEKIGGFNKTVEIDKSKLVSANITEATMLRGTGCLAVWSASLIKRFQFPFRTEPQTL
jgi:hypothetical protein